MMEDIVKSLIVLFVLYLFLLFLKDKENFYFIVKKLNKIYI